MAQNPVLTAEDVAVLNHRPSRWIMTLGCLFAAVMVLAAITVADSQTSVTGPLYGIQNACVAGLFALLVVAFFTPRLAMVIAAVIACYAAILSPGSSYLSLIGLAGAAITALIASRQDQSRRALHRRWSQGTRVVPVLTDSTRRDIALYYSWPFVVAALLVMGAIFAAGWCAKDAIAESTFRQSALTTQATVQSVDGDETYATVSIDGRRYDVPLPNDVPHKGDVITVRYDPKGERAEWAAEPFNPYFVLVWTGLGLVFAAPFAARGFSRRSRVRRLLRDGGVPVLATVSTVGQTWIAAADDRTCTLGKSFVPYLNAREDEELGQPGSQDWTYTAGAEGLPYSWNNQAFPQGPQIPATPYAGPAAPYGPAAPGYEVPRSRNGEQLLPVVGLEDSGTLVIIEHRLQPPNERPGWGTQAPQRPRWEAGRLAGERSGDRILDRPPAPSAAEPTTPPQPEPEPEPEPTGNHPTPPPRGSLPAGLAPMPTGLTPMNSSTGDAPSVPPANPYRLPESEAPLPESGVPGNADGTSTISPAPYGPVPSARQPVMFMLAMATPWWLPWFLIPAVFFVAEWGAREGFGWSIACFAPAIGVLFQFWIITPVPVFTIRDNVLVYSTLFKVDEIPWNDVIGVTCEYTTLTIRIRNAKDPSKPITLAAGTGAGSRPLLAGFPTVEEARRQIEQARMWDTGSARRRARVAIAPNFILVAAVLSVCAGTAIGSGGAV